MKTLASSLILEPEADQPIPPTVYNPAICTDADLVTCLTGIAQITRGLGYTDHPQTLYREDGQSASYHADHASSGVALAVDCNPERRTVSLAVTGLDEHDTHAAFRDVERALFGDC